MKQHSTAMIYLSVCVEEKKHITKFKDLKKTIFYELSFTLNVKLQQTKYLDIYIYYEKAYRLNESSILSI